MREQEQRKISFQGTIKSVQPRSNVWRYRLDNRTHSMTGYNIFLAGIADGEEKDFVIAISEKQQEKYKFHIGGLGKAFDYLQTPTGFFLVVLLPVLLFFIVYSILCSDLIFLCLYYIIN